MTTADDLEFLGYDKDNEKAWKHKDGQEVVGYGSDAAEAALDISQGGGWTLEAATRQFGPFTAKRTRKPRR